MNIAQLMIYIGVAILVFGLFYYYITSRKSGDMDFKKESADAIEHLYNNVLSDNAKEIWDEINGL